MNRYRKVFAYLFLGILGLFSSHNLIPHAHHSHYLENEILTSSSHHHHHHSHSDADHHHGPLDLVHILLEIHSCMEFSSDHQQMEVILKENKFLPLIMISHYFRWDELEDPNEDLHYWIWNEWIDRNDHLSYAEPHRGPPYMV